MTKELALPHYDALREELDAAITEMRFDINILKIHWTHRVGEVIRGHTKGEEITPVLTKLALDVGISERSLWRAVKIYDMAPEENGHLKLIEKYGKNVNVTQLLKGPEAENCEHPEDKVREVRYNECGQCGKRC